MIGMIATIKIRPGKEAEWEEIMRARRAQVLADEPGTLQYDLYRSRDDASTYVVIETYASEEAVEAHMKGSRGHERMIACFDGRPDMQRIERVEGCA